MQKNNDMLDQLFDVFMAEKDPVISKEQELAEQSSAEFAKMLARRFELSFVQEDDLFNEIMNVVYEYMRYSFKEGVKRGIRLMTNINQIVAEGGMSL